MQDQNHLNLENQYLGSSDQTNNDGLNEPKPSELNLSQSSSNSTISPFKHEKKNKKKLPSHNHKPKLNHTHGHETHSTKKQNLNHLLNFNFASRDPYENYYEYEKTTKQFWSTKLNKSSVFNKEQYLQANCQFVVKNNHDYSIHMVDPDRLVDWDKIEEIRIETLEPIVCPICLYEPVCAKMTKCGHIYCWSCILHYLSLSDKAWRKCPICYESIYKQDLKSVKVVRHDTEFKIGDEIKMNLMFKFKTKYNTIILPATMYDEFLTDEKTLKDKINLDLFNSSKYSSCKQYFKFHLKQANEIFDEIIKREREELSKQYEEEKNQPEVCFVNEAIHLLEQRELELKSEIAKFSPKSSIKEIKIEEQVEKLLKLTSDVCLDAFENIIQEKNSKSKLEQVEQEITEKEIKEKELNSKLKQNLNDLSLFYQSSDGQRIYVNGLNNRCLMTEYISLNRCPFSFTSKIVHSDSLFMTEENRKRYKYLSHLPLHSEFKLVELDLQEPIVSKKTLDLFYDEIEERRRFRERKLNREKKEADRIAALNETTPHYYVQSAMSQEPVHYIKSNISETVIDYEAEFPEASSSPPISSSASVGEVSTGSSVGGVSSEPHKSFAQMLKIPQGDWAKTDTNALSKSAWPSLYSNATSSNSSSQSTSGWVTMAKQQQQQQSMLGRTKRYQNPPSPWDNLKSSEKHEESELDSEHMPAPMYKKSFFSAIDESLKMIESKKDKHDEQAEKKTNQDQKKKKKTKQLLFSTSLNMGF